MTAVYKVEGMSCKGCAASVERAIKGEAPEAVVAVNLAAGEVSVQGATEQQVARAVDEAGFDFKGCVA